jgi:5-methylthioadenosine/S-adenosylhomocysteine deaminase
VLSPMPRLRCRRRFLSLLALTFAAWSLPSPLQARAGAEASGQPAAEPAVLLVTGGTVVTMDPANRVIVDGAVAVRDTRIVAVGTAAELAAQFPAARRLDASGKAVIPGLVNAHTHAPMTIFRGLADDLALMEWLEQHIFPAEAKNVNEDLVRWGTRLACLEMLAGGTTTFADMYYFEDAIAEETDRCGMRGVLGETVIDFPVADNKTWAEAMAYSDRFLARWKGHPRVVAAIAPHAPYTVSPEHLREAAALARKHGAPLLIHLAETASEVQQIQERYGTTPVDHLERLGVLGPNVLAAHVVWPTAAEIALLAERGVGVAHCPQSNMKLASGTSPVPELLAAGVAVGLATDGAASNNDLDMFDEMGSAARLHKLVRNDPTAMSAPEVLRMATMGGARALGLGDRIGSLEVGKQADLVLVDLAAAHVQPVYDVVSALVYAAKAADVDTVLVDGRVVVEKGEVLTVDRAATLARVRELRDQVRASLATPATP